MITFFSWIILTFIVAAMGSSRGIGFFIAFIVSLIFSPLIGFIVVILSKSNSTIEYEKKMLELQKQQAEAANRLSPPPPTLSEQLDLLKKMRDDGDITMEEFRIKRDKLLSK